MIPTLLVFALADLPKPTARLDRDLCGWAVRIDTRLAADHPAVGLLEAQLRVIAATVPADKLQALRRVPIVLDATYGPLQRAQYHVGTGWLASQGFDRSMADSVHIPQASYFASPRHLHQQPSAVMHELAHAYHYRVLGVDHPGVKAAWQALKAGGKYEATLTITGGTRRHYALTNRMEFFAEMTEAYLGRNDFYPFNAGELKQAEPAVYRLMRDIWGPLP